MPKTGREQVRKYAGLEGLQDIQGNVDPIITSLVLAYSNPAFVADALFPPLPVAKETGTYFTIDPNRRRFSAMDDKRAPRTRAKLVDWATSTAKFTNEEHAVASAVDDRERDNAVAPLDPDMEATTQAQDVIALNREIEAAALATAAGTYPGANVTTLVGGAQWNNAGATPINDVNASCEVVRQLIGRRPNTMVIPTKVMTNLQFNTQILDRIKYTTREVTEAILSALFMIPNIVVADGVQNTAKEGQAAAMADIWGKNVILAWVNPQPAIRALSFGYTFRTGGAMRPRTWREEAEHSDFYEVSDLRSTAVVANIAGAIIKAVIA